MGSLETVFIHTFLTAGRRAQHVAAFICLSTCICFLSAHMAVSEQSRVKVAIVSSLWVALVGVSELAVREFLRSEDEFIDTLLQRAFDLSLSDEPACCSVCLEDSASTVLRCGHAFHSACIARWVRCGRGKTCPVCRADVALREGSVKHASYLANVAVACIAR